MDGKPIQLLKSKSPTLTRSLAYMQAIADKEGFEIDVYTPTHCNSELLLLVAELGSNVDAQIALRNDVEGGDADPQSYALLKDACRELAYASKVGIMQGVIHPEPDDIERYDRLFNTTHGLLNIGDVKYSVVESKQIEIVYTIAADDEEVLKLMPNVQLSLLDLPNVDYQEPEDKPDRDIDV